MSLWRRALARVLYAVCDVSRWAEVRCNRLSWCAVNAALRITEREEPRIEP